MMRRIGGGKKGGGLKLEVVARQDNGGDGQTRTTKPPRTLGFCKTMALHL
jgi:hypothetical protein